MQYQSRWILLLTFTFSLAWGNSSLAYFYPDEGDLFYNGYSNWTDSSSHSQ